MWARLKQQIWQWRGVVIAAPSVAGVLIILRLAGGLQLLELAALDRFFRLRPLEPADSRIVLVTIDESDIRKLGQWPISDAVLAHLLLLLKQQQPRVIGLDLYRNLPVEPGHQELVKVFASTPNLIGIKKVVGADGDTVDPPPMLSQLDQIGASDLVLDIDGKLRRNLLYLNEQHDQTVLSLGAKLALTYLKAEGITPKLVDADSGQLVLGQAVLVPLKANDGGYIRVDVGGYQILSDFRQTRQGFRTISLTAVLQGQMPPNLVRDRIVLIGSRAESVKDSYYTSYSTSLSTAPSGVEVHADLASQLLSTALEGRPLLRVWPEPLQWLWIVVWALIGASLGWRMPSLRRTAIGVLLLGSVLVGGAYLLFLAGWWLIVVPPILALVGSATASSGYLLWENLRLSHQQLKDYARDLEQSEQVSRGQTETLVKSLTVLAAAPVLDNFLGYVLQAIVEQLGDCAGEIWLYDQALDTIVLHLDYEDGQLRSAQSEHLDASSQNISQQWDADYMQLLREKKILIQDVRQYADSSGHAVWRVYNEKRGMKTMLVVSLSFGGTFLGKVTVWSTRQRDYKPEEVELARVLAYQATLAIQLTRLAKEETQAAIAEERNRMAREIHDTLAQTLTSVIVQLEVAKGAVPDQPETAYKHISRAGELAREGLQEARRSVWSLRPEALENRDFSTALLRTAQRMTQDTTIQVEVCIEGIPYGLPAAFEQNLLRIGQEALTNVLKHAQAQNVRINLQFESTAIHLQIIDDGQGFDPQQHQEFGGQQLGGFGLLGMQERVQCIGGQLTITSTIGQGSAINVTVPTPQGQPLKAT